MPELPSTPIPGPLVPARFLQRLNRFLLRVRLEGSGEEVEVHMADPGRMKELLVPERHLWLRPASNPARKTPYSAVLAESPEGEELISLDTTLPNRLVQKALEVGALVELEGWKLERAEVPMGRSRLDFLLARVGGEDREPGGAPEQRGAGRDRVGEPLAGESVPARKMALEVKSVSLVEEGVALFPDAVTARGARHVQELAEIARRPGWEAGVLFVLQRSGAREIRAARSIDPAFARALEEAREAGVRILGRRCQVHTDRVELADRVPAGVG